MNILQLYFTITYKNNMFFNSGKPKVRGFLQSTNEGFLLLELLRSGTTNYVKYVLLVITFTCKNTNSVRSQHENMKPAI